MSVRNESNKMQSAKNKITECVETYVKIFPEEFELYKKNKNQCFKETTSLKCDALDYLMARYPETLFSLFVKSLDEAELAWFKTLKGTRWFISAFPLFGVKYVSSII